jgi:hypothetical protein
VKTGATTVTSITMPILALVTRRNVELAEMVIFTAVISEVKEVRGTKLGKTDRSRNS